MFEALHENARLGQRVVVMASAYPLIGGRLCKPFAVCCGDGVMGRGAHKPDPAQRRQVEAMAA